MVFGRILGQIDGIRADILLNRLHLAGYLAKYTIFDGIFGQIEDIQSDIGKLDRIRRDIWPNNLYSTKYLSNSTVLGGIFGQKDGILSDIGTIRRYSAGYLAI